MSEDKRWHKVYAYFKEVYDIDENITFRRLAIVVGIGDMTFWNYQDFLGEDWKALEDPAIFRHILNEMVSLIDEDIAKAN